MKAQAAGSSPARLLTAYRQLAGEGLRATVQRMRIEHACKLLRETQMPLAQVAVDCGFYDQSHFTHAFSRAMRYTPSAWRRHVTGTARPGRR